jgi:hypothetical protein
MLLLFLLTIRRGSPTNHAFKLQAIGKAKPLSGGDVNPGGGWDRDFQRLLNMNRSWGEAAGTPLPETGWALDWKTPLSRLSLYFTEPFTIHRQNRTACSGFTPLSWVLQYIATPATKGVRLISPH